MGFFERWFSGKKETVEPPEKIAERQKVDEKLKKTAEKSEIVTKSKKKRGGLFTWFKRIFAVGVGATLLALVGKKSKEKGKGFWDTIKDAFKSKKKENIELASQQTRLPEVKLEDTVFVGDSLTNQMGPYIQGAEVAFKGGKQTSWMREQLDKILEEKKRGGHKNLKRIVILGGTNNLNSCKSVKSIIDDLKHMYKAAKDAGLTVVACTIPDENFDQIVERLKKRWKNRGWNGGEYPLADRDNHNLTRLERNFIAVNNWIRTEADVDQVIDLSHKMANEKSRYPLSKDGVHLGNPKKVAEYITKKANIKTENLFI